MSFLLTNTQGKALAVEADGMFSPYQKVEYLESTGTQYIDTGISPSQLGDRFLYHIEIMWQTRSNRQLMGAQNINFWGLNASGKYESYNATVYTGSTTSFDVVEFVMAIASGKTYRRFTYINEVLDSTSWSSTSAFSTNNICIFGMLNTSGQALDTQYACSCKIKTFKIYNDQTGDVYYDAIPVRVGNVGYMYDRVSGQLFGNSGTGDFIIGPDIPGNAITVKQNHGYVTDGLIFWVDGIDKGASDGSWVDKIGGHTFAYDSKSPTSTDTGFYFDGTNGFYNNTFKVETSPTTHTIEVVISDAQVGSDGYCLFTSYATSYTNKRLYVAFVGSKSKICLSAAKTHPMYNYTAAEDVKSIVSCPDGRCYINNVLAESNENNYYSCSGVANRIGYGYYSSKWRHEYVGNVHAIRIYDRSLTADEIAHNYALDMMRFNL